MLPGAARLLLGTPHANGGPAHPLEDADGNHEARPPAPSPRTAHLATASALHVLVCASLGLALGLAFDLGGRGKSAWAVALTVPTLAALVSYGLARRLPGGSKAADLSTHKMRLFVWGNASVYSLKNR